MHQLEQVMEIMRVTLAVRGYDTFSDFTREQAQAKGFSVASRDDDSPAAQKFYGASSIACSFALDQKAKSSEINAVLRSLRDGGFTHGIAVFHSLTAGGIRTATIDIDIRLELFSIGEVIIDILQSRLYIPHIPLIRGSPEDTELRVHAGRLPILRCTDAIARRLGLLPKQVVLVKRSELPFHKQIDAYRFVR